MRNNLLHTKSHYHFIVIFILFVSGVMIINSCRKNDVSSQLADPFSIYAKQWFADKIVQAEKDMLINS